MGGNDNWINFPGGFRVRARFEMSGTYDLGAGRSVSVVVGLSLTTDGRPRITHVATEPPLGPTELAEHLPELCDLALREAMIEALLHNAPQVPRAAEIKYLEKGITPHAVRELGREAYEVARAARLRRGATITPDHLAEVLKVFQEGGIGAVRNRFNYSRQYAYKLVKRAKEEL